MEPALSVRDVLTKDYVGVSESDTVLGAVQLMREERAGCVLVVRGTEPVGIVTEWDILGLVEREESPSETTVEDVMSTPVLTVDASLSLTDAATRMTTDRIRHLVVTNEDELLGILTQRDVIAAAGSFRGATASDPDPVSNQLDTAEAQEDQLLTNGGDEYTTQGVCEVCGSLAESLWESNGKLLCSDCRSV